MLTVQVRLHRKQGASGTQGAQVIAHTALSPDTWHDI